MGSSDPPRPPANRTSETRVRIAISSCLLGNTVRYDGRDKYQPALIEELSPLIEWVPVCPEVEIGLGTPRPPIRLEGNPETPRLVMPSTGDDLTGTMRAFAMEKIEELRAFGIRGFVLKSRSPSCGIHDTSVFDRLDREIEVGPGAFVRVLLDLWPELPIADEIELADPENRTRFLTRVSPGHS